VRGPALFALTLVLGTPVAGAEPAPALRSAGGRLLVQALPDVLSRPEVAEELTTGLTTTFVLEVNVRDRHGGRAAGGGLVEVRYDLWDEVYLASSADLAGPHEPVRLPSRRELGTWWRTLELVAAPTAALAAADAWQVKVKLTVVPFSSAEQRDAQRWFSRSLPPGPGEAPEETPGPDEAGVLNLLIATSIGRPADLAFEWRVEVSPGARD
jgi:hypothetical protein